MAENLDKAREKEQSADAQRQFLTFTVMGEEYGVNIMTVREIKGWTETTRLPNSPECLRGVMNLRGIIVPIFDLRARFNRGITQANIKHVIIIMAIGDRNIGILVDSVSDILTVNAGEIKPAPEVEVRVDAHYIDGLISLENRMVVLLKVEHMFDLKEIEKATKAA